MRVSPSSSSSLPLKVVRTPKILALVPKSPIHPLHPPPPPVGMRKYDQGQTPEVSSALRRKRKSGGGGQKEKEEAKKTKKKKLVRVVATPTTYEAEAVSHPLARLFSLKVTGIRRKEEIHQGDEDENDKKGSFSASPRDPLFNNKV